MKDPECPVQTPWSLLGESRQHFTVIQELLMCTSSRCGWSLIVLEPKGPSLCWVEPRLGEREVGIPRLLAWGSSFKIRYYIRWASVGTFAPDSANTRWPCMCWGFPKSWEQSLLGEKQLWLLEVFLLGYLPNVMAWSYQLSKALTFILSFLFWQCFHFSCCHMTATGLPWVQTLCEGTSHLKARETTCEEEESWAGP